MKEMKDYLSKYKEEMPEWLKNYKSGNKVSFSDFMSGRIGYYPGSGEDGCLVKVANEAHCVHSFLYVDYHIKKTRLQEILAEDGAFRGYHSIGQVEWTERDLMPNGQYPISIPYRPINPVLKPMDFVDKSETPYIFMEIFERDSDKDDSWGAKRFAVAFLFADGIATYYQLFVREYHKAPWLFLLQDHGWGLNYDRFSNGGFLDKIMKDTNTYPEYVICPTVDSTKIWEGYELVRGVLPVKGGMHNIERFLFVKSEFLESHP